MACPLPSGCVHLIVSAFLLCVAQLLSADTDKAVIHELPVKFEEGLLWMDVKLPQANESLHFLVDSGASVSVVNSVTARRLGLKIGSEVTVNGVDTVLTGHWPVKLSARASQIELPREYLALDLTKLSDACGRPVDGLVGADFFRDRVVQIDYTTQKLRVLAVAPSESGSKAIPLESRPGGFLVTVKVNGGRPQRVRVDTGCATAFQWVTSRALGERGSEKMTVGLAELAIPQTTTGLLIGNRHLDAVPTGLHCKAIFPGESGLLGNALLAEFGVVTFDPKSARLILGDTLKK